MSNVIIAPSILSADFSNLREEIAKMEDSGATFIHLDVMDGIFVPNKTFGPELVAEVAKDFPHLVKDAHLMVADPLKWIPLFAKAGADIITVHYEAFACLDQVKEAIDLIHSFGIKAGLSIKPMTSENVLIPLLPTLDLILVMSVEPGKGGQAFMENSLEKIAFYAIKKMTENHRYLIEVDGGINAETGARVVDAGAEVLVAGSYLFGHEDYRERVRGLLAL